MTIQEYVIQHTERGECQCGQCCDKGNKPDQMDEILVSDGKFLGFRAGVISLDRDSRQPGMGYR